MEMKIGKWVKYALSLSVAAVLLYFCFRGVNWREFGMGLLSCKWQFVIFSMLAGTAAFIFRGLRLRHMVLPLDPATRRITTYDATTIGNMSNFVFPFLGEFVRCGIVTRRSKVLTFDKTLGAVAVERAWDMLSLVILMVTLLIFKWHEFGGFFTDRICRPLATRLGSATLWIGLAVLVIAGCAALFAIIHYRSSNKVCGKIYSVFDGLLQGFKACFKMDRKWIFFLETAVIWAMYWLQIVFLAEAFPMRCEDPTFVSGLITFGLVDALFIMLAGSLASVVPVPGGIGAYHFIVAAALLSIYGISWDRGLVFATLSHESQALTMILTGVISYLHYVIKKD